MLQSSEPAYTYDHRVNYQGKEITNVWELWSELQCVILQILILATEKKDLVKYLTKQIIFIQM